MSKQLSDLCTLLVRDLLGAPIADVFTAILSHGRSSIPDIARSLRAPFRHVENALVVLVQQRLVYYEDTEKIELYEVNLDAAYSLMRPGRNVDVVQDSMGNEASHILSSLVSNGCISLPDHVQSWSTNQLHTSLQEERTQANGTSVTNGVHPVQNESMSNHDVEYYRAFSEMASTQVVRNVGDIDFTSEADLHSITERLLGEEEHPGYKAKTGIRRIQFRLDVRRRKRAAINDTSLKYKVEHAQSLQNGSSEDRTSKKRKLSKEQPSQSDSYNEDYTASNHTKEFQKFLSSMGETKMSIRPDQERLNVMARSQLLGDMSTRFLGPGASKVYRTLLKLADREDYRCFDPYPSDSEDSESSEDEEEDGEEKQQQQQRDGIRVSTFKISELLPADFDIDTETHVAKDKKVGHAANETSIVNGNAHPAVNGEPHAHLKRKHTSTETSEKLSRVEDYLQILASHSMSFVNHHPRPSSSSIGQDMWSVPFDQLSRDLVFEHLISTIMSLFGRTAARLIRILVDKGKLDEKQLSAIALIPQRNVRELLNEMQTAGFVGIQEVPRENTRQPSRTIYLWFFDAERTRQLVLDDTYKTMTRFLQRRNAERQKYDSVIEKSERSDVQGHEAKFLSVAEQSALKEWRDKELKILVQLQRLDQGVLVLKDLLPPNALHDA